ncbi:MAG: DNA methyltransferase [Planctomycetota bacterium]|nr:DNA methyltransferase [Planctomycetota bacterium]
MSKDYRIHPLARLFPSMPEDEFRHLRDDIRRHGLREPITLLDGKILDGVHRNRACRDLGVDAETKPFNGDDPLAYVMSANLARRHLSASQKAMIAVDALPLFEKEAKKRQGTRTDKLPGKNAQKSKPERRARDDAAKAFDVSPRYIEAAKAIVEHSPELAKAVRSGKRTINRAMKTVKQQKRQQQREEAATCSPEGQGIITGDFRKVCRCIKDATVDFIFTDPPYDKKAAPLYADLAEFAARVLRPGGWCLAYSGRVRVMEDMRHMAEHLTYGWMFACVHGGGCPRFRNLKLQVGWKPILGFYKPPLDVWWDWFSDSASGGREKQHHDWQQAESEAAHFIQAMSPKNGLICDPFCGSGTTLVAAKRLGREAIGFEVDAGTAAEARKRLTA